jgi:hypothetical protein
MSRNNNRKHFVQVFVNKITGIGTHLYVQAMIMVEGFCMSYTLSPWHEPCAASILFVVLLEGYKVCFLL